MNAVQDHFAVAFARARTPADSCPVGNGSSRESVTNDFVQFSPLSEEVTYKLQNKFPLNISRF